MARKDLELGKHLRLPTNVKMTLLLSVKGEEENS